MLCSTALWRWCCGWWSTMTDCTDVCVCGCWPVFVVRLDLVLWAVNHSLPTRLNQPITRSSGVSLGLLWWRLTGKAVALACDRPAGARRSQSYDCCQLPFSPESDTIFMSFNFYRATHTCTAGTGCRDVSVCLSVTAVNCIDRMNLWLLSGYRWIVTHGWPFRFVCTKRTRSATGRYTFLCRALD